MSICRIEKTSNYTVMSNYHFKDSRLSLKAIGLLSKILSLPDNWDYSIKGLVSICKENETAIKSALKELKDCGYLVVNKIPPNSENGGRWEYDYIFYEQPQINKKQETKKQEVENLYLENHTLNKITNKQNTNKLLNNKLFNNINITNCENLYSFCINCIDEFCNIHSENNLRDNLIKYLKFRLEVKDKPLYKNMWKGILTKLDKIYNENEGIAYGDIISQSLERGYLTFYPINNKDYNNSNNIHWKAEHTLSPENYKIRKDMKF